ncbi:hypothetical protein DSM100688_0293 [Bifidobacterium ramosum]|uniref:DUF3071 domain-containing protein n=1 Tax=Bifidobacterium ramosum TaxID=1798158 RepID=A0A6L4X3U0_9BIFI|nr:septation protein SepH [Bifidobacterium ramosum]KAB8289213.1 hypothetical protein DSM100688_0293 [Bifidobacterium ramosum]NEG70919.1 DUF3071 domain-containing protein [Bifidobacterium ramosum]
MPENPLEQARFDHVDDAGDLVFAVGNLRFAVSVDDTLERAILEAKQIRSESQTRQPKPVESLPISQIQSLIRAGADPARVAERYGLSEALVRRFSSAVETEKQYAIEQFLSVPAPKESRVRTVSELIERTLATARIGMETLAWQATRRGHEPWRITARFTSAGRGIKAEWTWDMHDNAVVCVNSTAKKLLGEQNLGVKGQSGDHDADAEGQDGFALSLNLPGDSLRSARIEREVSRWATPDAADGQAAVPPSLTGDGIDPRTVAAGVSTSAGTVASPTAAPMSAAESTPSQTVIAQAAPTPTSAPAQPNATSATSSTAQPDALVQPNPSPTPVKPAKRKSGRSAVPSWDEILFGE